MPFSNRHNIHPALAVWLADDDYDGLNEDNAISVTSLIKPTKQIVLGLRATSAQGDLINRLASRYGTAMHDALEHTWLKSNIAAIAKEAGLPNGITRNLRVNPTEHDEDYFNIYLEQRESKPLDGFLINGKYDMIMDGEVNDYKTTSTYTYTHNTMGDKYILQGSLYRWLNPDKITADTITIHFIFTDWSKLESIKNPNYPRHRILSKQYPLMDIPETQAWLSKKLNEIRRYLNAPEEDIPQCTPADLWQSKPTYKYYKDSTKTNGRSTANFDNPDAAYRRLTDDGGLGIVITDYGKAKACKWCSALNVCQQAKSLLASNQLSLED